MKNFSIKCFDDKKQEVGEQVISMSNKEIDDHKISFTNKSGSPLFVIDSKSSELILDNSSGDFDSISTDKPIAKIKVKNIKIDYNQNLTFTLDGSKATYRISGNSLEQKTNNKFEIVKSYSEPLDVVLPSSLFDDIENKAIIVNGFPFQLFNALSKEDENQLHVKKFSAKNGLLNLIKFNNQIYIARGHKFIPIEITSQNYYKIGNDSILGITLGSSVGVTGKQKSGIAFKLTEDELESVAMFINGSLDGIKFRSKKDLDKNDIDYSKVNKQSDLTKVLKNEATTQKGESILDTSEEIKEIPVEIEEVPTEEVSEGPTKDESSYKVAEDEKNTEITTTEIEKTESTKPTTEDSKLTTDTIPFDDTEELTEIQTESNISDEKTKPEKLEEAKAGTEVTSKDSKIEDKKETKHEDKKEPKSEDKKEGKKEDAGKPDDGKKENKAIKKSIPISSVLAIAALIAFIFTGIPFFMILAPALLMLDLGAITYAIVQDTTISKKVAKDKSKRKSKEKPKEKTISKTKSEEKTTEEKTTMPEKIKNPVLKKIKDTTLKCADYAKIKMHEFSDKVKDVTSKASTKVKETAKVVGAKVIDTAKEVGNKVVNTTKEVASEVVKGTKDILNIKQKEKTNIKATEYTTTKSTETDSSKSQNRETDKGLSEENIELQTISASNRALAERINAEMVELDSKLEEDITDLSISPEDLKKKLEERKKLKQSWDRQRNDLTNLFNNAIEELEDEHMSVAKQIETHNNIKEILDQTEISITTILASLSSLFNSKTNDDEAEL